MQDSLRLVFIFVGIIAIGALLAHGFWSNRKKSLSENEELGKDIDFDNIKTTLSKTIEAEFDADGVGKVRTLSSNKGNTVEAVVEDDFAAEQVFVTSTPQKPRVQESPIDPVSSKNPSVRDQKQAASDFSAKQHAVSDNEKANALHFSANSRDEPSVNASEAVDTVEAEGHDVSFNPPPKSLLKDPSLHVASTASSPLEKPVIANEIKSVSENRTLDEQGAQDVLLQKQQASKPNVKQEPHFKKPAMEVASKKIEAIPSNKPADIQHKPKKVPSQPQDVYILNVAAKEGMTIEGAKLLPLLLRLGFKFGDMDIFHRHQDAAGHGPVLFSLASMVKPGVFDLDTIEQFSTQGVSLFFTVPCQSSASSNFKIMLQAAQKLSMALDAQLLDQHRNPLNDQAIRHTMNKVLEFERQQLLGGKLA